MSAGKINLSVGRIAGLTEEFATNTREERESIYGNLLVAPYMNSDTTNIRVNGKQKYVVVTANEKDVLYFFREHKGIQALEETPVQDYQHTLIHDHDKSYYHYGGSHQECLSHVLRYLQDSIENEADLTWNKKMKEFLQIVIHRYKTEELTAKDIVEIRKEYRRILEIAFMEYDKHPPSKYYRDGYNLAKRLDEYSENHLYFLDANNITYTNNLSERLLRQIKRKAKQVGTFRSNESARYFCDAMSMIETAKQNNQNIYDVIMSGF